jgi:hypothetical protein
MRPTVGSATVYTALTVPFAALLFVLPPRTHWSKAEILDAIRMVESGNRPYPPDGDGGRAIGPYQIHRRYWQDALDADPSLGGSYEQCREEPYARAVVDAYMRRWANEAWRTGHAETIARIHNGGPNGHRKETTLRYWGRVEARLRGDSRTRPSR